jgi:hypothetical protein
MAPKQIEQSNKAHSMAHGDMQTLQRLYDSEINFSITTFWDDGFTVKLGDELNGFKWEGNFRTISEAVGALMTAAMKFYPDSVFASQHRNITGRA